MQFFLFCQLRRLVFDHSSPVQTLSESRGGQHIMLKVLRRRTDGQTEILVSNIGCVTCVCFGLFSQTFTQITNQCPSQLLQVPVLVYKNSRYSKVKSLELVNSLLHPGVSDALPLQHRQDELYEGAALDQATIHSTAMHCMHSSVHHCTAPNCTALHSTALHCIM